MTNLRDEQSARRELRRALAASRRAELAYWRSLQRRDQAFLDALDNNVSQTEIVAESGLTREFIRRTRARMAARAIRIAAAEAGEPAAEGVEAA